MSQKLTPPIIILCITYLLICPNQSFETVTTTLVLWYQTVLPTLFPALLLISMLTSCLKSPKHSTLFCILTGIFCGFPIGCKTTCSCHENGTLSKESAALYSVVFNQFSPVFLSSYVANNMLKCHPAHIFVPLYVAQLPVIIGYYLIYIRKQTKTDSKAKRKAPQVSTTYQVVDASIILSCETLVKIGGYMILCALLQAMLVYYTKLPTLKYYLAPLLETTNGIFIIQNSPFNSLTKKVLTLSSLSFGGLCGALQVSGTLHHASLSVRHYLVLKLITSISTALTSYIYFLLF